MVDLLLSIFFLFIFWLEDGCHMLRVCGLLISSNHFMQQMGFFFKNNQWKSITSYNIEIQQRDRLSYQQDDLKGPVAIVKNSPLSFSTLAELTKSRERERKWYPDLLRKQLKLPVRTTQKVFVRSSSPDPCHHKLNILSSWILTLHQYQYRLHMFLNGKARILSLLRKLPQKTPRRNHTCWYLNQKSSQFTENSLKSTGVIFCV